MSNVSGVSGATLQHGGTTDGSTTDNMHNKNNDCSPVHLLSKVVAPCGNGLMTPLTEAISFSPECVLLQLYPVAPLTGFMNTPLPASIRKTPKWSGAQNASIHCMQGIQGKGKELLDAKNME